RTSEASVEEARVVGGKDRVGAAPDDAHRYTGSRERGTDAGQRILFLRDGIGVREITAASRGEQRREVGFDGLVGGMRGVGVAHAADACGRAREGMVAAPRTQPFVDEVALP